MTKQRHSFTTKAIYHHTKAFRLQGLCERRRFRARKPPFVSAAQAVVRTSADLEPDISENTEKSGKNTP